MIFFLTYNKNGSIAYSTYIVAYIYQVLFEHGYYLTDPMGVN